MKKFYSHLVEIEEVTIELGDMELAPHEKHELANLVDSNLHNAVMDSIFSKLSDEEKHAFLHKLKSNNHDEIWEFLNSKNEDIEGEIKKAAKEIKKQLKEDIEEAKKIPSPKKEQ
jgi:hypothetical protein